LERTRHAHRAAAWSATDAAPIAGVSRADDSLEALVAHMAGQGYDWDAGERVFRPRSDGPAAGRFPLTIREALSADDPDRYRDWRTGELREPRLPPVRWPPWAW
jgi:hypothetical protein